MTKTVGSYQGEIAIVDDDAPAWIFDKTWTCDKTHFRCTVNNEHLLLHRVIMGAKDGDVIDHINGDPLDCRKSNLRFATNQQNSCNIPSMGVTYVKGKWQVAICNNGKHQYLGRYKTFDEARAVRLKAEQERSAEFMRFAHTWTEEMYWLNRRSPPNNNDVPWVPRVRKLVRGSTNGNSRFTEEQVHRFIELYQSGKTIAKSAKESGISPDTGYGIIGRKTWCHITKDIQWRSK